MTDLSFVFTAIGREGKKRDGESGQQIFMAAATVNAVVVVVVLKVIRRSTKVSRVLLSWASCL